MRLKKARGANVYVVLYAYIYILFVYMSYMFLRGQHVAKSMALPRSHAMPTLQELKVKIIRGGKLKAKSIKQPCHQVTLQGVLKDPPRKNTLD